MKTTKKIFAAVLAVMMIALMIPFSASAATSDAYNAFIKGKNGFTVNVYKVAKINTTTGEYTEIQGDTAVATALKIWKNAQPYVFHTIPPPLFVPFSPAPDAPGQRPSQSPAAVLPPRPFSGAINIQYYLPGL